MQYLEVPLNVGYKLSSKRFGLEPSFGISFGKLIVQKGHVSAPQNDIYLDIDSDDIFNTSKVIINLHASLLFVYDWSDLGLDVYLSPAIKYQANSILSDSYGLKAKPLFYGVNAGVRYNFNR